VHRKHWIGWKVYAAAEYKLDGERLQMHIVKGEGYAIHKEVRECNYALSRCLEYVIRDI
jgi:ATP-dependent DNA ligase